MSGKRLDDLKRFYNILTRLEETVGGSRRLSDCSGRMDWPKRGVYFFQEEGEYRSDTGKGFRIVRIGTHALSSGAGTSLWGRLSQHRGSARSGGGSHRASIFRLIVGEALMERDGHDYPSWGKKPVSRQDREEEQFLEREVSKVIGDMPFVWLAIEDDPGPESLRGYIERNAIALLSNRCNEPLDSPSGNWLAYKCNKQRVEVKKSGLWNSNHVSEKYMPAFLDTLEEQVNRMEKP